MLQDRPAERLLRDDVPFAPANPPAPLELTLAERAVDLTHRYRAVLTVVFGALIAAAAFFAYQAQRADDTASGASASGPSQPGDGVAAAVAGMEGGKVTSSTDGGPAAPSTVTTAGPGSPAAASATTTATPPTTRSSATATTRKATSRTAITKAPTTAAPTTTAAPATEAPTTTVAPTTTAPPATTPPSTPTTQPRPVYIGDQVTFDDWNGAAARGIQVTLLRDADGNGVGEGVREAQTTSDAGRYGFSVEAGCYVVTFSVPSGQEVLKGSASRPLCLTEGNENAKVDLVISRPVVPAPRSCSVLIGRSAFSGVYVTVSAGNAVSYAFYDEGGGLVLSTASLGGPDYSVNASIGWTSAGKGYEENGVRSVAAEDGNGTTSKRVTCGTRRG